MFIGRRNLDPKGMALQLSVCTLHLQSVPVVGTPLRCAPVLPFVSKPTAELETVWLPYVVLLKFV